MSTPKKSNRKKKEPPVVALYRPKMSPCVVAHHFDRTRVDRLFESELMKDCQVSLTNNEHSVVVFAPDNPEGVEIWDGDWVFYNSDGKLKVVDDEEFTASFTLNTASK